MTGIEILRRVKENKYLKCAPVVVLTTTDDAQEIKRCYELGCNVYITKPVNYESFANAIRQLGLFFSVIQVPQAAHMNAAPSTLLYIDDDEALARLVKRGLTRLGFNVVHAANGEAGLARLQQGGIDVIALDQYMPGLDGLETLARILKIPDAPPVVFVTASQDSSIAVTALKAGAADYLVKDTLGDFIPLLHVAVEGALQAGDDPKSARRRRGRGPCLARPLRRARRRTRGAAARGQSSRRQQSADHRLAAAPAGQFQHARTTSRRR